jgi:hypothetical protein
VAGELCIASEGLRANAVGVSPGPARHLLFGHVTYFQELMLLHLQRRELLSFWDSHFIVKA